MQDVSFVASVSQHILQLPRDVQAKMVQGARRFTYELVPVRRVSSLPLPFRRRAAGLHSDGRNERDHNLGPSLSSPTKFKQDPVFHNHMSQDIFHFVEDLTLPQQYARAKSGALK